MDEPCPFCEAAMQVVSSTEYREFVEVVMKCPQCGFKATFEKSKA